MIPVNTPVREKDGGPMTGRVHQAFVDDATGEVIGYTVADENGMWFAFDDEIEEVVS